jgi:TRAP-type C4-dicarboxylate transport system permease small subunit
MMTTSTAPTRHPVIGGLTRLLEMLLIVTMGILVIDVLWGVLSRILAGWGVLASQSSWTEELARYLMIWVGLLGASLAFEKRAHLGVDYFVGKLHPTGQKLLRLATFLVILLFAVGVLVIGGWELVSRTLALKQDTPALGIPKGWVYLAVPISGVFTVIFTVGHTLDVLRNQQLISPTSEEADP